MKKTTLALAVAMLTSAALSAHCNCPLHSRQGISAPHGGQLEITDNHLAIELVNDGPHHRLYIMDQNLRPIDPARFRVAGIAEFPKKQHAPRELTFTRGRDHVVTDLNIPRGVHRYTLKVEVAYGSDKEQLTFIIEP